MFRFTFLQSVPLFSGDSSGVMEEVEMFLGQTPSQLFSHVHGLSLCILLVTFAFMGYIDQPLAP